MTVLMSNLRIGRRMLIAAAVPVIGLAAYAGILFSERFGSAREMQRIAALAELAPRISAVVHEMQRERGQSAGFIASKGVSFA